MRRTSRKGETGPNPPAEELIDTLGLLFMHIRDHFERGVQRYDLPGPCAKALRAIDGAVAMKDLGARMHCDASFVTAVADMLEERGLARREIDRDDRRIKKLVLTDAGTALRARIRVELFDDVPGIRKLDAAERATLLGLLQEMIGREQAEKADHAAQTAASGTSAA